MSIMYLNYLKGELVLLAAPDFEALIVTSQFPEPLGTDCKQSAGHYWTLEWLSRMSEIKRKIIGTHYTLLEVKTTLTKLQSHHAISEFLDNSNVNRSQPVQIISSSRRIDLQTAGSVKLFFYPLLQLCPVALR